MKGISYTLEAVIAVSFLLLSLVFFFKPFNVQDSSEYNYKKITYDSLKALSEGGKLRQYTLNNDATSIKNDLTTYISFLDYDVVIYNKTSNLTAIPTISDDDVISVSYFLAGEAGNYSAKEVRVFVWGFD
jgi:hypothetical protein